MGWVAAVHRTAIPGLESHRGTAIESIAPAGKIRPVSLGFKQTLQPAALEDKLRDFDVSATSVLPASPHAGDTHSPVSARCFGQFGGIVGAGGHPNDRLRIERAEIEHDLGGAWLAWMQYNFSSPVKRRPGTWRRRCS